MFDSYCNWWGDAYMGMFRFWLEATRKGPPLGREE